MDKYCDLCFHEFEDGEVYYRINGENVCDDCVRVDTELNAIAIEKLVTYEKINTKSGVKIYED